MLSGGKVFDFLFIRCENKLAIVLSVNSYADKRASVAIYAKPYIAFVVSNNKNKPPAMQVELN